MAQKYKWGVEGGGALLTIVSLELKKSQEQIIYNNNFFKGIHALVSGVFESIRSAYY